MQTRARQTGLTFISLMVLMVIGGFFVLLALRLGPMYLENYTVKSVLKDLKKEPDVAQLPPQEIWSRIDKRLYINEVRRVDRSHFKLTREGAALKVTIAYDIREHILGNVDALVSFSDTVELPVH